MDRFLRYIPDKEPVIGANVLAAVLLGVVVLIAERLGITFSESELLLLGTVAFVGATALARHLAFAPATYHEDVDAALHEEPPKE